MIRRVVLPLKLKIILLLSFLLLVSTFIYFYYAVTLFSRDKKATIFELGARTTENIQRNFNDLLKESSILGQLLYQSLERDQFSQEKVAPLFNLSSFLLLSIQHDQHELLRISKNEDLNKIKLKQAHDSIIAKVISESGDHFLQITQSYNIKGKIFSVLFLSSNEKIISNEKGFSQTSIAVIDDKGNNLLDENNNKNQNASWEKVHNEVNKRNFNIGSFVYIDSRESYLVSAAKTDIGKFYVVALTKEEEALLTLKDLQKQTLYFALFILSITSICGILFSRSLTNSLEKLFSRTISMSEGDFESTVTIKGSDEIGALSDAFNHMSSQIVYYMQEMKEKARIEGELAVAQLVQQSFFPKADEISSTSTNLSIYGHYMPASECGGDWWGFFEFGPSDHKRSVVFIGDATGHGVPAAFLTATCYSCKTAIQKRVQETGSISLSDVVSEFNTAINAVGGGLAMTFNALLIDHSQSTLSMVQASHLAPIKIPLGTIQSKDQLIPILAEPGPRLGEKAQIAYKEETFQISKGEKIILYTDGVEENHNNEGKPFGNRRLFKYFVENASANPKNFVDNFFQELDSFCQDTPIADDQTMVCLEFC